MNSSKIRWEVTSYKSYNLMYSLICVKRAYFCELLKTRQAQGEEKFGRQLFDEVSSLESEFALRPKPNSLERSKQHRGIEEEKRGLNVNFRAFSFVSFLSRVLGFAANKR